MNDRTPGAASHMAYLTCRPCVGLLVLTICIVYLGGYWGYCQLVKAEAREVKPSVWRSLESWDSVCYVDRMRFGVRELTAPNGDLISTAVFFPLYPTLGYGLSRTMQLDEHISMRILAWAAALVSLVLASYYLRLRTQSEEDEESCAHALKCMCLLPTALFLVTPHTEALFLMWLVLFLVLVHRGTRSLWIALVVALATATRSVGVTLLLPFLCDQWRRSKSKKDFLIRAVILIPLSLSGLLIYMGYLQMQRSDALAFIHDMPMWLPRQALSAKENLFSLVTFEPFWSVYDRSGSGYWLINDRVTMPLFSLQFLNPVFYSVICLLVVLGGARRWLGFTECSLSFGLLGMPYIMQSHCSAMQSHARYAAMAFPAYIVMGKLMQGSSRFVSNVIYSLMGVSLFYFAALMAAGYKVV